MPDQFVVLGASLVVVAALHLFLKYATLGLTMRATAESPELARVNGIDVDRVIAWTWALAAALAAMAGAFLGLTVQLPPEMGFNLLLDQVAAAESGITAFDCADVYTGVEEILGESLAAYAAKHGRDAAARIRIHTKFIPAADLLANITKADVAAVIDRSLQRLRRERLD